MNPLCTFVASLENKNRNETETTKMNKVLQVITINRYTRCIVNANNLQNASKATGLAIATIKRIIKRGWADTNDIAKLDDFCDKVEGVTETATA